jgi:hypothetical protein
LSLLGNRLGVRLGDGPQGGPRCTIARGRAQMHGAAGVATGASARIKKINSILELINL